MSARIGPGLYRRLLDEVDAAIVVTDTATNVAFWSRGAERLFGWTADEALGRPARFLTTSLSDAAVADSARRRLSSGERWQGEVTAQRKDGTSFPARWTSAGVVKGEQLVAMIGVAVDISEEKRADEALRASERRFRTLVEAAPEAILVVDQAGLVVLANPVSEALFGQRRDELVGSPVETLLPERLRAVHADHRARFEQHPRTRPMGIGLDLVARRADGSEVPVEIGLVPVELPEGPATLASIQEITLRLALEETRGHSRRMEAVAQLAGGVAHDFNNLLTSIIGFTELARSDLPVDDPRRASLDHVLRAAERATDLVGRLLAFSRHQMLRPNLLELGAWLGDLEPRLRTLAGDRVGLELARPSGPLPVQIDHERLDRAVLELADNACRAMPAGGTLGLALAATEIVERPAGEALDLPVGRYALVRVQDTGVGMDAATRGRIFDPFFSTQPPPTATGLGLAAVHGFIRQSGGQITVDSAPGAGTTFTIHLPMEGDG